MGFFNDKIAQKRMEKAKKEFNSIIKPVKHFTKMDIVESFLTNKKSSRGNPNCF